MSRYENASKEGYDYNTATCPVEWGHHTDENCGACQRFVTQLQGCRPAKRAKGRGRPKAKEEHIASKAELITHVDEISPVALKPAEVDWLDPLTLDTLPAPLSIDDVTCPICSGILDAPLSLPYGHITCALCMRKSIVYSVGQASCPCCTRAITNVHAITLPARFIIASMHNLKVRCPRPTCAAIITLKQLPEHYASCKQPLEQTALPQSGQLSTPSAISPALPQSGQISTPSAISLRSVLDAPLDQTPTLTEQRTATHIIRRMANSRCANATEQDLRLPTGGQVKILHILMYIQL